MVHQMKGLSKVNSSKCKSQPKDGHLRKEANVKAGSPSVGEPFGRWWARVHLDLRQDSSVGLGAQGAAEREEGEVPRDGA